jgi:glucokinase
MGDGADRPVVAAIDVGGTTIKGDLVDSRGCVLAEQSHATPAGDGPEAVVRAVRDLALELARSAQRLVDGRLAAVGVVVPGVVDARAGIARKAVNLGWSDVPLRALLEADLGVRVALGHDVRAAGLAERVWGLAGQEPNVLVVVLGTGIGAVATVEGTFLDGALRLAGEFGHLQVSSRGDWVNDMCSCGQVGCLETVASAAAVSRRYRAVGAKDNIVSRDVVARIDDDPAAGAVWRSATEALGRGLAAYVTLIDPGLIILSGGLANAGEALRAPVSVALAEHLRWRTPPPLVISSLMGQGGRMGAAALAWDVLGIPYPTAFVR